MFRLAQYLGRLWMRKMGASEREHENPRKGRTKEETYKEGMWEGTLQGGQ